MRFFSVFIIYFTSLFFISSCASFVEKSQPDFATVKQKILTLENNSAFLEEEAFIRNNLVYNFASFQKEELRFYLAKALFNLKKYDKSLNVLKYLSNSKRFQTDVRFLGAFAAFYERDFDKALLYALSGYPFFSQEKKIKVTKIILFSYLYSKQYKKALAWYLAINKEKKESVKDDLDAFFLTHSNVKALFEESKNKDSQELLNKDFQQEFEKAKKEFEEQAPKEVSESLPKTSENQEIFEPNRGKTPDWTKLCVFLSEDKKWEKFNEVIKPYLVWYFRDYRKTNIVPKFYLYLTKEDVENDFQAADEQKCFAVMGPVFSEPFSYDFYELSKKYSIPVFSYTPYFSKNKNPLFFNVKYTKNREAKDVASYFSKTDKKRFAILYVDNFEGRKIRDSFWSEIEKNGGIITEALAFSPDEKSFLNIVESIVRKPEKLKLVIKKFKKDNKDKYASKTLMNRAVDRLLKMIPGEVDFDVAVVVGSEKQIAMLVPSFSYANIELNYLSKREQNRIKSNDKKLKELKLPWTFQKITLVVPSEMLSFKNFKRDVGKFIDGMVSSGIVPDLSDKNQLFTSINTAFKSKFQRNLYLPEIYLTLLADSIYFPYAVSDKKELGDFLDKLHSIKFKSILNAKTIYFDENGNLDGDSTVYHGTKSKGFLPAEFFNNEKNEEKSEDSKK